MSALFGKKNYRGIFERLVRSGNTEVALREATKNGDTLYELGNVDEAIFNYETLLNILIKNDVSKHEIYEKVYEKLSPLYLETGNTKKGIEATFQLVDRKITLKKTTEAVKLLKALENAFYTDKNIMLKILEIYYKLNFLSDALEIVNKLIRRENTNVEFLTMGGEILYKLGRLEEASTYFDTVTMLDPDNEIANERLRKLKGEGVSAGEAEKKAQEAAEAAEEAAKIPEEAAPKEVAGEEPEQEEKVAEEKPKTEAPAGEVKAVKIPEEVYREDVNIRKVLHSDPEYLEALECLKKGKQDKCAELLLNVAKRFEDANFAISEYVYDKLFIIDPANIEAKLRVGNIFKEKREIEDCVFYLKSALRNAKDVEKVEVLKELADLVPDDIEVKTERFNIFVELKKFDEAFNIFFKLEDKELIEKFAAKMLPYLKEDVQSLSRIARLLKGKGLSDTLAYQYFYLAGKSLFNMGDNVEGLRWLIAAHRIAKLPLEDYVAAAQYVKNMPLEGGERELIGDAILGYIENMDDSEKQSSLLRLLLELKPEKVLYLVSYLQMLFAGGNTGRDAVNVLMKLVKMNSPEYADFIYDAMNKLSESLSVNDLNDIATFFDINDKKDEAFKIYSKIMEKEPGNKIALIKFFIISVEGESINEIIKFFDQAVPSHTYVTQVDPFIQKYKAIQAKNPFDHHVHFVLGFLYFLIERYEEAIASFQFVVRLHQFEGLMHYFLGICFEKILLEDFAMSQYSSAVKTNGNSEEIRLNALYRIVCLYKLHGNIVESKKILREVVLIKPDFKDAKLLLDSLPPDDKIMDLNKEEFK